MRGRGQNEAFQRSRVGVGDVSHGEAQISARDESSVATLTVWMGFEAPDLCRELCSLMDEA